jgi:hypothetical protein
LINNLTRIILLYNPDPSKSITNMEDSVKNLIEAEKMAADII